MSWLRRYRIHHYVTHAIWILPLLSIVGAIAAAWLLCGLEAALGWKSTLSQETVRTVLGMLASAMFTFIVFVCSALLIAVQLASAQLTPRIIAFVFRDPLTKLSLAAFVFTFSFTLAVLVQIDGAVPLLSVRLSAYGCVACLGIFLFLIDHVGKWLRPSGALRAVASLGRAAIETVYPTQLSQRSETPHEPPAQLDAPPLRVIPSLRTGAVLAFDVQGLVALAARTDCVIEFVPQVGDFVAIGDPLFRLYRGGDAIADADLRNSVAIGQERTMQQDPSLVFRILVDIASKGLSPAINDPTTAVLAIDQIHHLLRVVGGRHLDDERVRDAAGRTRLVFRTPAWEDYVSLAVTEIRHFGGESIQVVRRLRAMLENLIHTLPPPRTAALVKELELLERSVSRSFVDPEDRALANVGDFQGVGGESDRARNTSTATMGQG